MEIPVKFRKGQLVKFVRDHHDHKVLLHWSVPCYSNLERALSTSPNQKPDVRAAFGTEGMIVCHPHDEDRDSSKFYGVLTFDYQLVYVYESYLGELQVS